MMLMKERLRLLGQWDALWTTSSGTCQGHSAPLLLVPDVVILSRHYRETFAIFPLCGELFLSVGRLLSVEVVNSGRLSLSHVGRVERTRDKRRLPTSSFYVS